MLNKWKRIGAEALKDHWPWIIFAIVLIQSLHVPADLQTPFAVKTCLLLYFVSQIGAKLSPAKSFKRYLWAALALACWITAHLRIPLPDPFADSVPRPVPPPDIGPLIAPLLVTYAFLLFDYFSLVIIGLVAAVFLSGPLQMPLLTAIQSSLMASLVITLAAQLILHILWQRDRYLQLSITDSLTGLYSLDHMLRTGQQMMNDESKEIVLYLIDMNGFKHINDTYGHLTGNQVLVHVAELLKNCMGSFKGMAGRLGGDEFLVLIAYPPGTSPPSYKEKVMQAIEAQPFRLNEHQQIKLSFSVGEARPASGKNLSINDLLHMADMDMYVHKHAMKNIPHTHPEVCDGSAPEQRERKAALEKTSLP